MLNSVQFCRLQIPTPLSREMAVETQTCWTCRSQPGVWRVPWDRGCVTYIWLQKAAGLTVATKKARDLRAC